MDELGVFQIKFFSKKFYLKHTQLIHLQKKGVGNFSICPENRKYCFCCCQGDWPSNAGNLKAISNKRGVSPGNVYNKEAMFYRGA